ncbi:LYR motif containing protein 1-like isoform X2 [Acropora millepora]|uniref:LYR motif containing protein 1-like isoform X2 n=1 Tax=Acropora millepora TaxID=45264 RepID=UPI001CF38700|nr:LYR motif containing protein 1-like isoform X2 [Acropora millepora]
MFRQDVLSLYRRIFRISRQWEAVMPTNTEKERQYIQEEARKLFHRNKTITNPEEIRLHIHEANSRIDMDAHAADCRSQNKQKTAQSPRTHQKASQTSLHAVRR